MGAAGSARLLGAKIEINRVFLEHPSLEIAVRDEMVSRGCERARLDRLFHVGIEPQIEFFVEHDQRQKSPEGLLEPVLVNVTMRGQARSDDLVCRKVGLSRECPERTIGFFAA